MPKILESEKIYHGCFTKNRDGTNKLIRKGEKCLIPTKKPFWKYSEDVPDGIKTREQEKKQKKITSKFYYDYFKQKDIQRWLEADDSGDLSPYHVANNNTIVQQINVYFQYPKKT